MNELLLGYRAIAKSKLARRLVPILAAIAVAPLTATVFIVGRVGQEQIVATANTMQGISKSAVQDAGKQFQQLGSATVRRSGDEMAAISLHASQAVSRQWEKNQADLLTKTGVDFTHVTQVNANSVMQRTLSTNKKVLSDVSSQMGQLFASSAHYTQGRVVDRVQTAVLAQANIQMQERAEQLAGNAQNYIQTNQNYLALTAQMLNLYQGNVAGQKAVLDALVRRMPMLTVVSVLDATGQETAMSASDHAVIASDLANHSDTTYFQTAMKDRPYMAVSDFPTNGSAPTLRLAVPIELYRGKVIGVLAASLSLADLWDIVRNTRIGKTGFAYVTSPGIPSPPVPARAERDLIRQSAPIGPLGWRMVVAQPRQEVLQPVDSFKNDIAKNTDWSLLQMHHDITASSEIAKGHLQEQEKALHAKVVDQVQVSTRQIFDHLRQKTMRQTDAELATMQEAIRMQASLAEEEHNRQMVAAATTASQAVAQNLPALTAHALLSAKHRLSLFALIIIVVSCALSCLIALLMASAIVRPIVQLAEGTQAVAQGELERRVDERAPAEIGDLAVAFNTMAASLQKSRTDLIGAEAQLVQSAKLASLGTLSAGVAHELNQPVAIVRGIAQQLRRETGLSELVQEDLVLIEGQTSRMMKIIQHLRTFCRAGEGEMNSVDVNQVVQDCFILIDAQLKSHNIEVELDLCSGSPRVMGDANELEQVFINLITNARDAMEGRPHPKLTIRSSRAGSQFMVEFRDNGPGIPERAAVHIFDPFFTTKEVGKGTGLGLSISHSIIQKHRGGIVVKNDDGAVFTISLPLESAPDIHIEAPVQRAA